MIGWILAIIFAYYLNPLLALTVLILFLLWVLFNFAAKIIPQVQIVKSELLNPLVVHLKFKKLSKEAIKCDIEGRVNKLVKKLENELPHGWIKNIQINWVKSETQEQFLNEKQWVIRMRPLEDQANNFVMAVYYYFKKCLYPNNKKTIPESAREASSLFLCQRVIEINNNRYKKDFEDQILEPAVDNNDKILEYIDIFRNINTRGLFLGVYLREINEIATRLRFSPLKKRFNDEIMSILKHLQSLVKQMPSDERTLIADEDWDHESQATHYGFILIASPDKSKREGVKPYVNRAKDSILRGFERLYILGRSDQNLFTESVISKITSDVPELLFVEKFKLTYDYKGKLGGVGAIFELNNKK